MSYREKILANLSSLLTPYELSGFEKILHVQVSEVASLAICSVNSRYKILLPTLSCVCCPTTRKETLMLLIPVSHNKDSFAIVHY